MHVHAPQLSSSSQIRPIICMMCVQGSRLNGTIAELQTLLRHKDESSKAYRKRTDAQVNAAVLLRGRRIRGHGA